MAEMLEARSSRVCPCECDHGGVRPWLRTARPRVGSPRVSEAPGAAAAGADPNAAQTDRTFGEISLAHPSVQ
jgi:hypothetical protein